METTLEGHYSYGRLIRSSVPLVTMMIVTSIYSIVDGLFVSNIAGTTAFAALNLIWPALAVVGALGLMVGTGGSALVSKVLGEGDPERADRIFSMVVWFVLLISVLCAIPLLIWMEPLTRLLGAEGEEMVRQSVIYGRICAAGMPAFMMQMALQPYYMVTGKPQLGTVLSIASGLTNMALDALFILGFGWGIAGAATASMIACCVGGFIPLAYFAFRKKDSRGLHLVRARFERAPLFQACSNGLSEFVGNIAFNVLAICYNLQLMRFYGENGVAAYSVILYVGYIFFAIFSGYNLTVMPLVGYNYGAGDKAELHSLLVRSLRLLLGLGVILAGIGQLIAGPAARLFVGYDPDLTALTIRAMRIYLPSLLLSGLTLFVSAWFTGLNNGPISAVASFSRSLVFEIGAVFLLPALVGIDGIWLSVDIAEVCSLILGTFLLLRFRERYGY